MEKVMPRRIVMGILAGFALSTTLVAGGRCRKS